MKTFRLKPHLDSGDSQKVVLLIKSGSHKGRQLMHYSLNGYLYGANCKVGKGLLRACRNMMAVCQLMFITTTGKNEIWVLLAAFFDLCGWLAERRALIPFLRLYLPCNCYILYIPLMYIGASPFIAATASVVIITVVTFTLIADWQMKSIGAMLGTVLELWSPE